MGDLTHGIIYYTDGCLPTVMAERVRETIADANLPIVSCSPTPLAFGRNLLYEGPRTYATVVRQILVCLDAQTTDVIWFAEHDVLYHQSHWTFVPPRLDTWYYDTHLWRWWVGAPTLLRYESMAPLSMCCVGRETARSHYAARATYIDAHPEQFASREPQVARRWGYEPGRPRRRGGLRDERWASWWAVGPSIDLRHRGTLSPAKISRTEFRTPPTGWTEVPVEAVPEWSELTQWR